MERRKGYLYCSRKLDQGLFHNCIKQIQYNIFYIVKNSETSQAKRLADHSTLKSCKTLISEQAFYTNIIVLYSKEMGK